MMELQIGKTYWNGGGKKHYIAGLTRDYPSIVYSRGGDWFDKKTGHYVAGEMDSLGSVDREPSWRDLWSETGDD